MSGDDFAVEFEGVGHGEGVGVAGDGDDVLGAEDFGLLENFAADFGESQAVGGGIEVFQASGVLNGLEGYASHTGLSWRAKSMVLPISWSFRPFFSVTTKLVEML